MARRDRTTESTHRRRDPAHGRRRATAIRPRRAAIAAVLLLSAMALALAGRAAADPQPVPQVKPAPQPSPPTNPTPNPQSQDQPKAGPRPQPSPLAQPTPPPQTPTPTLPKPNPLATPTPIPHPTPVPQSTDVPEAPEDAEDADCWLSIDCLISSAIANIFVGRGNSITASYLRWLIEIPDVVETEGAVAHAGSVTQAAGWALLLGLVTFSIFYYYVSGLTSKGGGGALMDGILRSVGAALFILAWPWLYTMGVGIAHALGEGLISGDQLDAIAQGPFASSPAALFSGQLAMIIGIVVMLAFTLLSLALYLMKLGLTAGLCIAYLAAPIAAALWAIPTTAQPASYATRYVAAAASTQVGWALCLMAFGALSSDSTAFAGSGGWGQQLQAPLFGIAILGAMLAMPRHMFRAWGLGMEGGGSSVGRAAASMGMGLLGGMLRRNIPDKFGGSKDSIAAARADRAERHAYYAQQQERARQRDARDSRRGHAVHGQQREENPFHREDREQAHGRPDAQAPGANGAREQGSAAGQPAPAGGADAAAQRLPRNGGDGLPEGSRKAQLMLNARRQLGELRQQGVSADSVRAAMGTATQAGYGDPLRRLVGDGGGHPGSADDVKIGMRLMQASTAPGLSGDTSAAFMTIGAASPEHRVAGMSEGAPPAPNPTPPPAPSPTTNQGEA